MRKVPECLNRRYRAVDELINDLASNMPNKKLEGDTGLTVDDPSIKLMCEFWNILKENPDCDLPRAVHEKLCQSVASSCHLVDIPPETSSILSPVTPSISPMSSKYFRPQHFTCYMANEDKKPPNKKCNPDSPKCKNSSSSGQSPTNEKDKVLAPLSQVLCNLKEAASFDMQCNKRLTELMQTEDQIKDQISVLEKREKEGTTLLKQADCMWSCMEDAYRKKVSESMDRQKELLQQLNEVEKSAAKWRKSKKILESQLENIGKCQDEIKEKINQKTNDMKYIDKEIEDFKKRIEMNSKDAKDIANSLSKKKKNSDVRIANIVANKTNAEKMLAAERNRKYEKEVEGSKYIKEAREELQKICRALLQKRLENENLMSEKNALIQEIDMLKSTCNQCKIKCKSKEESIQDEIMSLTQEIKEYKVRCIQCHECTDTTDVRKFCTDCPRCLKEIYCINEGDFCSHDNSTDCVCQAVKQKFLDNVFENMYTVLESETRSSGGQEVAAAVLDCLSRSRNGKLDDPTKQLLQKFILSTLTSNLNLTVIGGAVKTRCEMDPSTYAQLMECIQDVEVTKPAKVEKGTLPRKEPCKRWGGTTECNCPKGPSACICTKKAPPHHGKGEAAPCPDVQEEDYGEAEICPHKNNAPCGIKCGIRGFSNKVGADVSSWRPDPCKGTTCTFKKNMRAAQCVLGPELLHANAFTKKLVQLPDMKARDQQVSKGTPVPSISGGTQLKAGVANESQRGTRKTKLDDNTDHIPQKNIQKKNVSNVEIQVSAIKIPIKSFTPSEFNMKAKEGCTSIYSTSSGNMAMQLDDKLIDKIEKRTRDSSNRFVSMRETRSGNFLIDFNPKHMDSDDSQKVLLKRTNSGQLSLEIEKNVLNALHFDIRSNKLNSESSISIELIKISKNYQGNDNKPSKTRSVDYRLDSQEEKDSKNKNIKLGEQKYAKQDIVKKNKGPVEVDSERKRICSDFHLSMSSTIETSNASSACAILDVMKMYRKSSVTQYKSELEDICNSGKNEIDLRIYGENESVTKAKADIMKSSSGNFSLNLNKFDEIGKLSKHVMEHPSLLKRSESGTYELYLGSKNLPKPPNTILRRNNFGENSIFLTEPVLGTLASDMNFPNVANTNKLYKLNVRANDDIIEVPALLQLTPSGNYILVIDKEFELEYKYKLYKSLDDDTACYIQLNFTSSNTVCIYFDDSRNENALLLKSPSGTIRVYVNGPIFESLSRNTPKGSKSSLKLLDKLITCEHPKKTNCFGKKNNIIPAKSNSDTVLCDKENWNIRNENEVMNTSATLKKTDSGQYAIVLNKESKKNFIKNMTSSLSTGFQGYAPIWTGEKSGEISITLPGKDSALKITPSGNMYAIVTESVINNIIDDTDDDHSAASKVLKYIVGKEFSATSNSLESLKQTSSHIIQKNKHPRNKAVATNCGATPNNDCNPDLCVCNQNDFTKEVNRESRTSKDKNDENKKHNANSKIYFCTHIDVGRSGGSRSPRFIYQNNGNVHPKQSSTDSSAITMSAYSNITEYSEENISDVSSLWDSLKYLPPQLPRFLKDDFK